MKAVCGNRGYRPQEYLVYVSDLLFCVLVLVLIKEISDQSPGVDEHGCSIHHTLSERDEDDFHLRSGFDPDTLREQSVPIVKRRHSLWGLEKEYEQSLSLLMKIQYQKMRRISYRCHG